MWSHAPKHGCAHTDRTPPDEAPERFVICVGCGKAIHTRWTGRLFEQLMETVAGECQPDRSAAA